MAAVALLLVAPALVACSAGRAAQTAVTRTTSDAAAANLGPLQIRNVYLGAPPTGTWNQGDNVPLYLTVATPSSTAAALGPSPSTTVDSVTGATSTAASAVVVVPAAGTATPSASPGLPLGETGTTATRFPLAIPAGAALTLGPDTTHLELQGLNRPLTPSQYVPVTLTFANAGSTTLDVPVALTSDSSTGP